MFGQVYTFECIKVMYMVSPFFSSVLAKISLAQQDCNGSVFSCSAKAELTYKANQTFKFDVQATSLEHIYAMPTELDCALR